MAYLVEYITPIQVPHPAPVQPWGQASLALAAAQNIREKSFETEDVNFNNALQGKRAHLLTFYHIFDKEMAQGTLKSKKLTTATAKASGRRPNALGPKKGARTIAPRKQVLVRNKGMVKVIFFFFWSSFFLFWFLGGRMGRLMGDRNIRLG